MTRPSFRCGFYDNGTKWTWHINGPGINESGFEDTADAACEALEIALTTLRQSGKLTRAVHG